jgi:hypothetical protein
LIRGSASSGRKLLLRGAVNKTQEIHRKVQHHETNMETVYKPHRNVSNARSNRTELSAAVNTLSMIVNINSSSFAVSLLHSGMNSR